MFDFVKINTKIIIFETVLIVNIQNIYALQANAQTDVPEFDSLRNVQVEKDVEFIFPSKNESFSIQDNFPQLEDYSVSEFEPESREEEPEWGNTGDVKSHSVDFEIYDY